MSFDQTLLSLRPFARANGFDVAAVRAAFAAPSARAEFAELSRAMAREVSEHDVIRRALDFARCHERSGASISVKRDGMDWCVTLRNPSRKLLRIAMMDGRMRN